MRVVAALTALVLVACSDGTGLDLSRHQIRTELEQNEAKWQQHGLANYRYAFRRVCDCPPEATAAVQIEVRDKGVVRVRLLSSGTEISPGSAFWPTIEDLFGEVRLALDEGAAGIDVRYDPVYGYPLEISVVWASGAAEGIVLYAGELMPIE